MKFASLVECLNAFKVKPNTGADFSKAGGALVANLTTYNTTGQTEQDFASYSVKAKTLDVNGDQLRLTAWGQCNSGSGAGTVKLYFAGTVLHTITGALQAAKWKLSATLVKDGANSLAGIIESHDNINGTAKSKIATAPILTSDQTLKITGQTDTSMTVTEYAMLVDYLPAP